MARKGQFKKGGGRHGMAMTHRPKTRTRTVVKTKTRTVRVHAKRRHRRGGKGGGGMPRLLPLALATAGLAYITNDSGPAFVRENINKLPGAKTFGPTTMAGLVALGVDRFVKPNKWLKLFGLAGVVLGAAQVGKQGTGFKWLGDGGDDIGDIGDDDVGDDEMGDDYVGDDG